ncbi:hypothetical protein [Streptomyces sp. NPDC059063]|uniref:hypothetical protein n=1 Tax=unclassified Streptomyces TaxID=2593676 RepID=UPI003680B19C
MSHELLSPARPPRGNDGVLAFAVAVLDVLIVVSAGYGFCMAGLTFGTPTPEELREADAARDGIVALVGWLAGGGAAAAAVFRYWKTAFTHLFLVGVPFLAGLALQSAQGRL